mgnify:FL=1
MIIKIYITTIIISIGIKTLSNLIVLKKVTLLGYKFIFFDKILKKHLIKYAISFIPIINIFMALKEITNILFLNDFIKNNFLLMVLNETDKQCIDLNNSFFNIIKINLKNKIYPDNLFIFFENGLENVIYYTIQNDKIIITSSKGPISKKNLQSQINVLKDQLDYIYLLTKTPNDKLQLKDNKQNFLPYFNFNNSY